MKAIVRDKQRVKQTGEVFTPLPLVDEILGKLDESVWSPEKTMIDNSCGDGNFLVRVIAWKIHKGSTAKQALETTYGVDLMEDNINHAIARVLMYAFLAEKNKPKLIEIMDPLDERDLYIDLHTSKWASEFQEFMDTHLDTVVTNIVCHDALTYDYNFEPR